MQSFEHLRESAISILLEAKKEMTLIPYRKAIDEDIQKLDKADTIREIMNIVEYRTVWVKEVYDSLTFSVAKSP